MILKMFNFIRTKITFNIQHSTFNIQHSTFNIQHSTFNIQHSTFNIQHSTFLNDVISLIILFRGIIQK